MGGAKRSTWIGGAAFLALVVVAAAYFLAIQPILTTAAESREQTELTRSTNDVLEMVVAKLAADSLKLPEYRAELASIREQIPATAQLASFLRQLDTKATENSVTVTSVGPSEPQTVALAADPSAVAPPVVDPAATEEETTESTTAVAPQPTTAAAPEGFVAVPVTFTVVGSYESVLMFVDSIQTESVARLFLVGSVSATSQNESEGGGGRPATVAGDLELAVTGFAYVLPDPFAVPAADPATDVPLPGAVPGRNAFVPFGGQ